jgi:hypothetical protein
MLIHKNVFAGKATNTSSVINSYNKNLIYKKCIIIKTTDC